MTLRIAHLKELTHLDRCVEIQIAVWGYADGDVIPRRMFLLAERIGGQVLGAFDSEAGDALVAFAMALPGYRDGCAYLHSHMLAVLPEYRNAGLGRRLKMAQREDALARGFALMEWTFDPLEIKNAYLNLHKLGAIVRRYRANFYGPSSSPLQGGLPTDRLYAEWWLRSQHVEARLRGIDLAEETVAHVTVPASVQLWKESAGQRTLAEHLQRANRTQFEIAFSSGLAAIDYARDAEGNGMFLLGPWPQSSAESGKQELAP